MKKLTLSLLFAVATISAFAGHETLNTLTGQTEMKVLCGETDSLSVIMNSSLLYFNKIEVSIKGAAEMKMYGYFWGKSEYTFPTNGDLVVSVSKLNLWFTLTPFFIILIVLFSLAYFGEDNEKFKWQEWSGITLGIIGVAILFITIIMSITISSFAGENYIFIPLCLFLVIWGLFYLAKQLKNWLDNYRWKYVRKKKGFGIGGSTSN